MTTHELLAIIQLLDKTSDEGYPALREAIIDSGELDELDVPYNAFEGAIRLSGLDPRTIERAQLRAHLCFVLQVAYARDWLRLPTR